MGITRLVGVAWQTARRDDVSARRTDNGARLIIQQPQPPRRERVNVRDLAYGVQSSRKLLIDTIRALAEFSDAITVVGAHAVRMWAQDALGPVDMQPPAMRMSP